MRPALSAFSGLVLLMTAVVSGTTGCYDMHDQPSYKAQEGPRLAAPDESVPVQGKEAFVAGEALINPFVRTDVSVERGKTLYDINCAMCHGEQGLGDGAVGKKFLPQPANLREERIQRLSDADLFKRITYGFGSMPSFKKRIKPNDRWNLVNYLRDFGKVSSNP
jgi:mono/diheme cytochrome c family protein